MLNKKDLLKKLLAGEEDPKLLLKKYALKQASDLMSKEIADSLHESQSKAKAAVTVATDDPKKLPEALEKAKELSEDLLKKGPLSLQDLAEEHLAQQEEPKKKKKEEEEMEEEKPETAMKEADEEEEEVEDELNLDELSPEELKKLLKKLL